MAYFNSSNFALYKKSKNPEWCQNRGFWVRKTQIWIFGGKMKNSIPWYFWVIFGFLGCSVCQNHPKKWKKIEIGYLESCLPNGSNVTQIIPLLPRRANCQFSRQNFKKFKFPTQILLKNHIFSPKYICINKKLDFSFSCQKFKF